MLCAVPLLLLAAVCAALQDPPAQPQRTPPPSLGIRQLPVLPGASSAPAVTASASGSGAGVPSGSALPSISVPQDAPVGGLSYTQPAITAAASYYKIMSGNPITFGWNFTNILVAPKSLTFQAYCTANSYTYPVGPTTGIPGTATQIVWDPYAYEQQPGALNFAQASYTLRVFDERGPTALATAGYFNGQNSLVVFAMYSPAAYTPLASVLSLLDLTDDSLHLIVRLLDVYTPYLLPPIYLLAGAATPTVVVPYMGQVEQLKTLALVHRRFLHSVRGRLWYNPRLSCSYYALEQRSTLHLASTAATQRGAIIRPLQMLGEALAANPILRTYVKRLDNLASHIKVLVAASISPQAISRATVGVLMHTPELLELDLPRVDFRDTETLINSVCNMRHLRVLRLGQGCANGSDASSFTFHEGDLRRISKACTELEELYIYTSNVGFGDQSPASYVERFTFGALKLLHLDGAGSMTTQHLIAMLHHSTCLETLHIRRCAGLAASAEHRLTTTGIATVLERIGGSLKSLLVDIALSCYSEPDDQMFGTTPPLESALVHCPNLVHLTLLGPGLVNKANLARLGVAEPGRTMAPGLPVQRGATGTGSPGGLQYLETLYLGIWPSDYNSLFVFLSSLRPGSCSTPFTSLKTLKLTYPPAECTGYDEASITRVTRLKALLEPDSLASGAESNKIELVLCAPGYEDGRAWARAEDRDRIEARARPGGGGGGGQLALAAFLYANGGGGGRGGGGGGGRFRVGRAHQHFGGAHRGAPPSALPIAPPANAVMATAGVQVALPMIVPPAPVLPFPLAGAPVAAPITEGGNIPTDTTVAADDTPYAGDVSLADVRAVSLADPGEDTLDDAA